MAERESADRGRPGERDGDFFLADLGMAAFYPCGGLIVRGTAATITIAAGVNFPNRDALPC
jgi:hypothetical protein